MVRIKRNGYGISLASIFISMIFMPGCTALPIDYPKTVSLSFDDTHETRLGQNIARLREYNNELSGFYLLPDGIDAFVARMMLVEVAERSLDVQYYIWHNDTVGRLFAHALLKAADRGVRVRVLLDDINLYGLDSELAALDSHANIEIRVFNPFTRRYFRWLEMVFSFSRINRRMHNKSLTADNQVTIVGGRNIGDEYFDINEEVNFNDLDVITFGPVVKDVSAAFDQYWNYRASIPVAALTDKAVPQQLKSLRKVLGDFAESMQASEYMQAVRASDFLLKLKDQSLPFAWGRAHVIYDAPEKANPDGEDRGAYLSSKFRPHLADTQSELILVTPYYIPGEQGMARIKELIARGVRVRVLTNSLASTDVAIVYAGYQPYRIPLLRAGVELYESRPTDNLPRQKKKYTFGSSSLASLHTKLYIFDRRKIFVGSINLDPRSLYINTELGIFFENETVAGDIADWLDKDLDSLAYRLRLVEEADMEEGDEPDYRLEWLAREDGMEKIYEVEPHTGFWRRLGVDLMSILPIEDEL